MRSGARRIIVAIDTPDLSPALRLARMLAGQVYAIKLGLEFIHAQGPQGVEEVQEDAKETRLFFDGKFSDIPNTVAGAVRSACRLEPWLLNVHAMAGEEAMKAAINAARKYAEVNGCERTKVIAVTTLTSLDYRAIAKMGMLPTIPLGGVSGSDLAHGLEMMGGLDPQEISAAQHEERVRTKRLEDEAVLVFTVGLAKQAKAAGLDGVVCSPLEVAAIRAACGTDFLIVAPGVRPAGSNMQDQVRVATPGGAIREGADYLVIGRPITGEEDPLAAIDAIAEEIEEALAA